MSDQAYEHEETRVLVQLVDDAAALIQSKGEAVLEDFRVPGSRWRQGESYIFVLDPDGNMQVHPDPELEGRNTLGLKDVNGKPIIQGLIGAATALPDKPAGWYHYQWPVPGGLLPRWKSSYVRLVSAPSGHRYIVGSGLYNDRMERAFVVDAVEEAIGHIEKQGAAAFPLFYDPAGPFLNKDAYIFVLDLNGNVISLPPFPNLEGSSLRDVKDTEGKPFVREILALVKTSGSGWVDYMWPKPGQSASTRKSTFVSKAKMGDQWVLVGCGVYLADAPKESPAPGKMAAPDLMRLVREGAAVLEKQGENAFPELRQRGSKWFHNDTYFFVWAMDGLRVFHAANPAGEGQNMGAMKDIIGRPIGRMILEVAASPSGEGWIHYLYPLPGSLFPAWKSTFVKRVIFPSGQQYAVGCGIYNMKMDRPFIEDVVNRAATLVEEQGPAAFPRLRDRTGPFVFMDTYVFVDNPEGVELVNPAFPSLEGRNLSNLTDLTGKAVVREQIDTVMQTGRAWLDLYWYRPGQNTPARKQTFVRKIPFGQDTYIVGSGFYPEEE